MLWTSWAKRPTLSFQKRCKDKAFFWNPQFFPVFSIKKLRKKSDLAYFRDLNFRNRTKFCILISYFKFAGILTSVFFSSIWMFFSWVRYSEWSGYGKRFCQSSFIENTNFLSGLINILGKRVVSKLHIPSLIRPFKSLWLHSVMSQSSLYLFNVSSMNYKYL